MREHRVANENTARVISVSLMSCMFVQALQNQLPDILTAKIRTFTGEGYLVRQERTKFARNASSAPHLLDADELDSLNVASLNELMDDQKRKGVVIDYMYQGWSIDQLTN